MTETQNIVDLAIEVATGFTLLSVLISILTEMIASFSNYRALRLRYSIKTMLGENLGSEFFKHPVIRKLHGLNRFKISIFFGPFQLSSRVFGEVVVDLLDGEDRSKGEEGMIKNIKESLDEGKVLTAGGEVRMDTHLTKILGSFMDHSSSESRLESFRERIELWFDENGKRTSSAYSRDMKVLGFMISMLILPFLDFDLAQYLRLRFYDSASALPWASGWFYQLVHLVFMSMLLSLGSETWFKFLNNFVKLRR